MSANTILFYSKLDDWYELSNVYPQGFEEEGVYWPSVEHYFQAMKFSGDDNAAYREQIRVAPTTGIAKDLGRTKTRNLRADWDDVRDSVMLHALRRKFAHQKLANVLLSTGTAQLAENSPSDYYWGIGKTGQGTNRLGQLLMQVREELRQSS